MYQVKWFNKIKGFGFCTGPANEELFCHHSDICVEGYKYLKRGEIITGTKVDMEGGKTKLANIKAVGNFQLMCVVEKHEPKDSNSKS